jgi:UDP-N-acetylmuramate: L-alanyl-gamma-D-glutamyl-meso-diaminopimelate ligase
VKVTIDYFNEQYVEGHAGKARLFALFEPRSATSRRKIFQEDYVNAFKQADYVFIATPYDQSKIAEDDRFSSAELVADIAKSGVTAKEFSGSDNIVAAVKAEARKGDVVLVMSNGAFDGIYQKLLKAL